MADLHLHLDGPQIDDHAEWDVDTDDGGFDAAALESAMRRSRREAYAALATLDAA